MSAQSLHVFTVVFPKPDNSRTQIDLQRINDSLSYDYLTSFDIRTLSTNDASPGGEITGFLYTPELDENDPCIEAGEQYIPANVTRQADLPYEVYDMVALAPWISPQCTLAYMKAARIDPVRGFFFFLPDNSSDDPPPANDPQWTLGDGGAWKQNNGYPVYVVPGAAGQMLLNQSALYSGNMTSVPQGDTLAGIFDSKDYVRLFADINTGGNSSLPSLWVFLLVVLAILLAIIGLTSLAMHWLQRRRRTNLRNRVIAGEIDLEALGVKRLTVPQELLDTLPLYTYGTARAPEPPASPTTAKLRDSTSSRPLSRNSTHYHPTAFQQPTCAICLEDYTTPDLSATPPEPGSNVRELPCHHIFHPECVDAFLRDNSSLCPMCKKSALPKGYCPRAVTNAMVRRERIMRRRGQMLSEAGRSASTGDDLEEQPPGARGWARHMGSRFGMRGNSHRVSSAPVRSSQAMSDLSSTPPPGPNTAGRRRHTSTMDLPTGASRPANAAGRREWARQRAVAMLGRRDAPVDPDAEESARTPRWRKVLGGVFPGLGGVR